MKILAGLHAVSENDTHEGGNKSPRLQSSNNRKSGICVQGSGFKRIQKNEIQRSTCDHPLKWLLNWTSGVSREWIRFAWFHSVTQTVRLPTAELLWTLYIPRSVYHPHPRAIKIGDSVTWGPGLQSLPCGMRCGRVGNSLITLCWNRGDSALGIGRVVPLLE